MKAINVFIRIHSLMTNYCSIDDQVDIYREDTLKSLHGKYTSPNGLYRPTV